MTTEIITRKEPIVNGSFNHCLTDEEMLAFDFDTKKRLAWNLIVSMEYAHSFQNIDYKVFEKKPSRFTYEMLKDESLNIDQALTEIREEYRQRHKELLNLTHSYHVEIGRKIAQARTEYRIGGFMEMEAGKVIGFIQQQGGFNNQDPKEVETLVRVLDKLAPTRQYGANNPNTGQKSHIWTTTGEYITMKWSYEAGEAKKKEILAFYKEHFEPMARAAQADSVRYEITDYQYDGFSLELIMWWD